MKKDPNTGYTTVDDTIKKWVVRFFATIGFFTTIAAALLAFGVWKVVT
jgi:hypothetical protein